MNEYDTKRNLPEIGQITTKYYSPNTFSSVSRTKGYCADLELFINPELPFQKIFVQMTTVATALFGYVEFSLNGVKTYEAPLNSSANRFSVAWSDGVGSGGGDILMLGSQFAIGFRTYTFADTVRVYIEHITPDPSNVQLALAIQSGRMPW